jgi:hypothetical protein
MKEESWIKQYWRPAMAWSYAFICLFDFMIAPVLTMIFFKITGGTYVQWEPLTLKESGFYHLSMAAIVGVAAWTRGKEKIERVEIDSRLNIDREITTQTPIGDK